MATGDGAAGLRWLQQGFGITDEDDRLWALGWPHMLEAFGTHVKNLRGEEQKKLAMQLVRCAHPAVAKVMAVVGGPAAKAWTGAPAKPAATASTAAKATKATKATKPTTPTKPTKPTKPAKAAKFVRAAKPGRR